MSKTVSMNKDKKNNVKKQQSFFITTPVYYANAKPHIGHAYTTIAADVLVRFKKRFKQNTFLLTGMDEHGAKIAEKARAENKNPQELVDEISISFKKLWAELEIDYQVFTRTTSEKHRKAVQVALQRLYEQGVIYKGEYEGLYCVGCEQFKTKSELVDGKCPDHNVEPKIMKEESYLMKMSNKQEELISKIENDEFKIRPEKYRKEILSFLREQKLEDLSISRKNIDWGIPIPFDKTHTVYVWFDAFLSYLTGLGWNGDKFVVKDLEKFWPVNINLIGKDILRVHATIWPIMLMYLGLKLPKELFVHGHILSGGKKMSKTLGNVIGIEEMLDKFGKEATRYLLLSSGVFGEDTDITMERMIEKYNSDLANGLGNLLSRIVTLLQDFKLEKDLEEYFLENTFEDGVLINNVNSLQFDKVLIYIWKIVQESNKYIEETKPWELKRNNEDEFRIVIDKLLKKLSQISSLVEPFMPEISKEIKQQLLTGNKIILFQKIK